MLVLIILKIIKVIKNSWSIKLLKNDKYNNSIDLIIKLIIRFSFLDYL